jgi:hypothetical protein
MNPCHLHDVRERTRPDDTTDTLSKHGGSLCYIPLLKCRRPRRSGQYRSKSASRVSNNIQVKHALLHRISPRHQRWPTISIHLVGGLLAVVHRASGCPPVPTAAPVKEVLDLEGAAETCTFLRRGPPSLGFGRPLSPSSG